MQMNKFNAKLHFFLLMVLSAMGFVLCRSSYASELPKSGNRYKIIRTIYLDAWYYSLNDKHKSKPISKKTACAYLDAVHNADRVYHAFRTEVPAGTIMTIIGSEPKIWFLPFLGKRYFVLLEPDLSRGLDVMLDLDNIGIEGNLDGLNPDIFLKIERIE